MPSTATSILDGLSTSVAVKAPCRTVATSNITLAGLQTISGYTTVENDRVLVKGQTNPVDNGIYMASTGNWARAKDADGNRDFVQGTRVLVRSTSIDGVEYELTTANPIVIGTSALVFEIRYGANATYDQTEAEIAAVVTPTNYGYEEGNAIRYGMVGDDSTNNDTAIAKLRSVAAQGVACIIPDGVYRYAASPNWNIPNLHLRGERGTILKHTGSGRMFNIDGGAEGGPGLTYGIRVEDIILQGNANSTHGVYSRGAVHCVLRNIQVRDCTVAAFHIMHGVSNVYDNCVISGNGQPLTVNPQYGFYLTSNGSGYYTADCTFINAVSEAHTGTGCHIDTGSGNKFVGGTFEAVDIGLYISADSDHNSFDSVWMEQNDTNDIVDNGLLNSFHNMYCGSPTSGNQVEIRGQGATIYSGFMTHIHLDTGSLNTTIVGTAVSSSGNGVSGPGTYRQLGVTRVDGTFGYVTKLTDVLGDSGSFTATLTGVDAVVTGTITWRINGGLVTLQIPTAITGTSNTTSCTLTGAPTQVRPSVNQLLGGWVVDSGTDKWGAVTIGTSGTITLSNGISGAAFTSSGTKGIDRATFTYPL